MFLFLPVVSGHCTVFLSGKLREGPKLNEAVIVRRPASYYLHYKIGLRVIVGAKLYHFCIAFHLIFFARYFCWIRQNLPKHQGFIPGFAFLFFPAKSCCKKITSTVLMPLHTAFR